MSRKEWILVIIVIGLGIVWQIPRHDDVMLPGREPHPVARGDAVAGEPAGPYRTVALEVTGMT